MSIHCQKTTTEIHVQDSDWTGSNLLPSIMARPKFKYYVDFTTCFGPQIMKLIEFNWLWHMYFLKHWEMLGLEAIELVASILWKFVSSKAWNCIIHKVFSFAETLISRIFPHNPPHNLCTIPPLLRTTPRTMGWARVWLVILSVRHSIYIYIYIDIIYIYIYIYNI